MNDLILKMLYTSFASYIESNERIQILKKVLKYQ